MSNGDYITADYHDMTDAELVSEARHLAALLTALRSECEGRRVKMEMEYFEGEDWGTTSDGARLTTGAGYIATVRRVEVTEL